MPSAVGSVCQTGPVQPTVSDNLDQHRYEARVGTELAGYAEYQLASELMVLTHTEVEPAYEGQGIGSALARFALDDVRSRGLRALLICPFITGWVTRHRDYADLLYQAPKSNVTD